MRWAGNARPCVCHILSSAGNARVLWEIGRSPHGPEMPVHCIVDSIWVAASLHALVCSGWSRILDQIEQIKNIHDGFLQLSINFGGWAVLAGDELGLKEFEKRVTSTAGFPRRLKNHSAFHSELLSHVAESAAELLDKSIFASSSIPMIDGRGHIWYPHCYENHELHDYTLSYQITNLYDFTRAIHVAALEFSPDVFITTGPGASLRRAIAESLIMIKWKGMNSKDDFERADKKNRMVLHSSAVANAGDL